MVVYYLHIRFVLHTRTGGFADSCYEPLPSALSPLHSSCKVTFFAREILSLPPEPNVCGNGGQWYWVRILDGVVGRMVRRGVAWRRNGVGGLVRRGAS